MAVLIKKLKKLSLADLMAGREFVQDHLIEDTVESKDPKYIEFLKVVQLEIKERVYDLFEETAKTDF